VRRALKVLVDREVSPQLGLLKSTLLQLDSTFSERTYGAGSFRDFAEKLATAGGTLGILIPPSVMLIVYAAVAGQSIVKLYAAAMIPGFFLTALYLIYIVGWAMINPKIAPKLPPEKYSVAVPDWIKRFERGRSRSVVLGLLAAALKPGAPPDGRLKDGSPVTHWIVIKNALSALIPIGLTVALFAAAWWYVIVHNAPDVSPPSAPASSVAAPAEPSTTGLAEPPSEEKPEALQELGGEEVAPAEAARAEKEGAPQEVGSLADATAGADVGKIPDNFYAWFWGFAVLSLLTLLIYYRRMDGEQLEILKMLVESVVPLGVLTFIVLAVILFGITTASESAGIGAVGALYLAGMTKYPRRVLWSSLVGLLIGGGLGMMRGDAVTLIVSASLGAVFAGTGVPWIWDLLTQKQLLRNIKESTFLTAKTTAMVCWLFVGSALFSAVFALHGGQQLVEKWVLGLNLSPLQFMILAQAIIFLLGWPLEWTEIIVIFVPIFIPLLTHFQVDPILFATMVAVNLQAAFLSPPVAMSAFYLKGVAPKHVTLNQIFAGMMPYMLIVIVCMVMMYLWPGMTLWLPNYLYGG
jgi:TRAP-type mannitol/chloroaromatic compound transport system permease large subunit